MDRKEEIKREGRNKKKIFSPFFSFAFLSHSVFLTEMDNWKMEVKEKQRQERKRRKKAEKCWNYPRSLDWPTNGFFDWMEDWIKCERVCQWLHWTTHDDFDLDFFLSLSFFLSFSLPFCLHFFSFSHNLLILSFLILFLGKESNHPSFLFTLRFHPTNYAMFVSCIPIKSKVNEQVEWVKNFDERERETWRERKKKWKREKVLSLKINSELKIKIQQL